MTEHDPREHDPGQHDPGPNRPLPPEAADPANPPPPEPEPEPMPAPPPAPPRSRDRLTTGVVIAIAALVVLAAGEVWLFQAQSHLGDQRTQVANLSDQVDTLRGNLTSLRGNLTSLRGRLAKLETRVTALANRPAPPPAKAPPPALPPDLANRIAAMQASIASLSTTALADHAAVTRLRQQGANLPRLVARARTLAAVAQASLDLQNGQPLGAIPNAPQALARYATAKPPTLAGLKASFSRYAAAASRAGGDTTQHGSFWQSVKTRVEGLVTVRSKDKVLLGSTTDGILGAARAALDGNDLAGALAALKSLPPAAAADMRPWTKQASHLLAARAALARLAEQG